jgi:hypothetical protein
METILMGVQKVVKKPESQPLSRLTTDGGADF